MPKISKALRNPGAILPYLRRAILRKLCIRKVRIDGEEFFRYRGVLYPEYLNNRAAAPFIFETARKYCRGRGIDVGAGVSCYPGAEPVQEQADQNAYRLDRFGDASLDYVFSSHCLEHLERWQEALCLWIRKLRPGGWLFIYLPHHSMALWRPKGLWAGNDHKWVPTVEILRGFLEAQGMRIAEYNDDKDEYWSFHIAACKPE